MERKADSCKRCPLQMALMHLLPLSVRDHLINAQRELLLAVKALIDERISRLEDLREPKAKKVDIE